MIVTWSSGAADDNMSQDILTELAGLIERHPWWQARARLALALLSRANVHSPARVLEAGCGWGVNLAALENHGYHADGLDISRQALERLDRPGRQLIEADLTQPIPIGVEPYDAVLALDVIEHLDDDGAAVATLAGLVKPGGTVLVSVPALPELFSEFDRVQGHRRRYLPETLRRTLAGAGLAIEKILWWGAWMVPVLKRRLGRSRGAPGEAPSTIYKKYLSLPPWPGPLLLRCAFAVDQVYALRGAPRIGTSLVAVARRQPA